MKAYVIEVDPFPLLNPRYFFKVVGVEMRTFQWFSWKSRHPEYNLFAIHASKLRYLLVIFNLFYWHVCCSSES